MRARIIWSLCVVSVATLGVATSCGRDKAWPSNAEKGFLEQCATKQMSPAFCDCALREAETRIAWDRMKPFMDTVLAKPPTSREETTAIDPAVAASIKEALQLCQAKK